MQTETNQIKANDYSNEKNEIARPRRISPHKKESRKKRQD